MENMKKIGINTTITIALLLAVGGMSSCKRLIEIPGSPPTQITTSQQFKDSASILSALAGVYNYVTYGTGFTFNSALLTRCTGLSSDEISISDITQADLQAFFGYGLTPINSANSSLWSAPYTGVYPVNVILEQVASNKTLSTPFRTQLNGELKVVRALYYFYLVNLYGGVPVVTSSDYNTTARIPRASVDSVYAQIMDDLNDAKQDLTANYPANGRVRPNLYTALALLAKVELYRKNWQAAYDAANTVITSGVYSLETDLNNVFLDGSNEAIWQIPATGCCSVTQDAQYFVPYFGSLPTYPMTPFLTGAFETGDQRWQKWVGVSVAGSETFYYPYKYKVKYPDPSGPTEDYMVLRLAEQYLIRAEAAAQLGNTGPALDDLNQVRQRAGLLPSTATGQADILAAILRERQVELFTEWGNRWFDLKRTGLASSVLGAEKPGWNPTDTLYPVPNTQRQLNNLLLQNPGYN
jgi:hypothetical protein